MNRITSADRPWYFWPLIAFLAGLFIGWIVIGWGLWPVNWTNASPADMRAESQYEYLTMVAESYAANGDVALARERVASFDPDQLGTTLVDLQEYLIDTDANRATQVQALIATLRLDSTRPQVIETPAAAAGGTETARTRTLGTVLTSVLWAVLVVVAVAFIAWLFLRWRRSQGGSAPSILGGLSLPRRGDRSAADIVAAEKARDIAAGSSPTQPYGGPSVPLRTATERSTMPVDDWADDFAPSTDRTIPSVERRYSPPTAEPAAPSVEPVRTALPEVVDTNAARPITAPAPVPSALPVKLGEFMAVYPDETQPQYDEVFDLKDPTPGIKEQDRWLGQCSVTVQRPEGVTRGPTYAFQLWLSDRRDSDYQVKVLMSEGAYRDTSLRAEYAGKLDVLPVRPGAEFEMSTRYLILRARVEQAAYDETQEPLHGVFSDMNLRLIAYRRP